MRAAGCYQADEVRFTGERFAKAAKYHTDTKDMTTKIALNQMQSMTDDLDDDIKIVCVELAEGATPLPQFNHPQKALYIFGPEDSSIPQSIVDKADEVVYVPTIGCMNLAATVNVLLYDRLAKSGQAIDHTSRVLESRDVNNRLKVSQHEQS
ncbi:hypothetical protein VHA01S_049_00360 [Vibrio halioticoli NBRC 102217]|uniref:tRNA/rRNA methyltransferase SpoU type domain-containing protein n=2 Tax=Vibrio halioticoli TaxID=71388 RepID=V5FLV2_9VIBR|nr:hypothetical protein VHA01S_049_00360 [Vibrio halioticoli NBRC 102217]